MLISRVQMVLAAVLLMSSASAEAMEFADRPGVMLGLSSAPSSAVSSQDRLRRQIDRHIALERRVVPMNRLADRPRPVTNLIRGPVVSVFNDRPGRLSAEFSATAVTSGIELKSRYTGSIHRRPDVVKAAMRFEDRPGFASNQPKAAKLRIIIASH
jgi:hypothetical protein